MTLGGVLEEGPGPEPVAVEVPLVGNGGGARHGLVSAGVAAGPMRLVGTNSAPDVEALGYSKEKGERLGKGGVGGWKEELGGAGGGRRERRGLREGGDGGAMKGPLETPKRGE